MAKNLVKAETRRVARQTPREERLMAKVAKERNQCADIFCRKLDARKDRSVRFHMSGKESRRWEGAGCGSSQHMRSECPVKEVPRVKKEIGDDRKGKEAEGKTGEAQGSSNGSSALFLPPNDGEPAPAEALVKEAVQLLKSLRPSIKAVTVCAVNKGPGHTRALLDGGATHILRPAHSKAENRASCLAEALQVEEVTLAHRMGTSLWADGLTKSLPAQSLEKLRRGLFLCRDQAILGAEKVVLAREEGVRLSRCMAMMIAGAFFDSPDGCK